MGRLIRANSTFGISLTLPDGTHVPIRLGDNNLLYIDTFVEDTPTVSPSTALYVKSNKRHVTFAALHQMLGHISYARTLDTLKVTTGVNIPTTDIQDFFCHVYALAKSTRRSFSKIEAP